MTMRNLGIIGFIAGMAAFLIGATSPTAQTTSDKAAKPDAVESIMYFGKSPDELRKYFGRRVDEPAYSSWPKFAAMTKLESTECYLSPDKPDWTVYALFDEDDKCEELIFEYRYFSKNGDPAMPVDVFRKIMTSCDGNSTWVADAKANKGKDAKTEQAWGDAKTQCMALMNDSIDGEKDRSHLDNSQKRIAVLNVRNAGRVKWMQLKTSKDPFAGASLF